MNFLAPAASHFSLTFVYIYTFLIFISCWSYFYSSKFSLINADNNFPNMRFAALTVDIATFLPLDVGTLILSKLLLSSYSSVFLYELLVISLGNLFYKPFSLLSMNYMIIDIYFRNLLSSPPLMATFSIPITLFFSLLLFTYFFSLDWVPKEKEKVL